MLIDLDKIVKNNTQFLKYAVGGAVAFVVDVSLLYILTEMAGLWYLWSATFSFIVAAMVNYLFQRFWTFKSQERRVARQFLTFLSLQAVGLFINSAMMYLTVEYLGLWYIIAKAFAALVVLIWNFWSSKEFVFNKKFIDSAPKIILAGETFPPDIGAAANYSDRLARYLLAQGYHLKILCYSPSVDKYRDDKIYKGKVVRVNRRSALPLKYFTYFVKLINISLGVDIIYAQSPLIPGIASLVVSKLLRKRLVVKISGDYCWELAQLNNLTKKSIDDWQQAKEFGRLGKPFSLKLRLADIMQKLVARGAHQVIVPSFYLKKLITDWGVNPYNIKVVYNAVEFKPLRELPAAQAKKEIGISGDIILTGGKLYPWKGFAMLIEIMPRLKQINPNFSLVIFGEGPQRTRLNKLIQANDLSRTVHLVGQVGDDELYKYFSAASLFVLNSGYEGLSRTILEAMYYRLPIIVSDKGGNPELIQDDYNGLLVEYNNKQEWIKAVERIWRDTKLRRRFSRNPLIKLEIFKFAYMAKETLSALLPDQEKNNFY